jgi:hypothetical protein
MGAESCLYNREKFEYEEKKEQEVEKLKKIRQACLDQENSDDCSSEDAQCLIQKEKRWSAKVQDCEKSYTEELSKKVSPFYFCDDAGNPGELHRVHTGDTLIEKASYCIDHSFYDVISWNCIKNKKNCQALKAYQKKETSSSFQNENSNPLHLKCRILGGNPQIVLLKSRTGFMEKSLCFFSDETFISIFFRYSSVNIKD